LCLKACQKRYKSHRSARLGLAAAQTLLMQPPISYVKFTTIDIMQRNLESPMVTHGRSWPLS
jgi:hypothetical protein